MLEVKPPEACKYDLISLGEVMLRLDPGESRIRTARHFTAWEGGGEYNVARGLSRCFGLKTGLVSSFADNEIGRLIENYILQGGVCTDWIRWVPSDGSGRNVRNGLNFTERGFGVRGAIGVSDRGATAASQLKPGDIDWAGLFGDLGVRWFHTGGIFAALSDSSADVVVEAIEAARSHGTVVSYDLNYRPSLWDGIGGKDKAQQVNRHIAPMVDVMIGNEEDFTACLGLAVDGLGDDVAVVQVDSFRRMIEKAVEVYPNFAAVATTLRTVKTATVNSWGAICWYENRFFESTMREDLEILDRVGGGDSFASGFIYGMLSGKSAQTAVEYGAAHGALAMSTPGDTSMASLDEVISLAQGGSLRVKR